MPFIQAIWKLFKLCYLGSTFSELNSFVMRQSSDHNPFPYLYLFWIGEVKNHIFVCLIRNRFYNPGNSCLVCYINLLVYGPCPRPSSGLTLKEKWHFFSRSYYMPRAVQIGFGLCVHTSLCVLGFCLIWLVLVWVLCILSQSLWVMCNCPVLSRKHYFLSVIPNDFSNLSTPSFW